MDLWRQNIKSYQTDGWLPRMQEQGMTKKEAEYENVILLNQFPVCMNEQNNELIAKIAFGIVGQMATRVNVSIYHVYRR